MMHRHSRLERSTSRVSEKILDYYLKFGRERDLEKFMRIHSPTKSKSYRSRSRSGSRTSQTTTTTSSSSCVTDNAHCTLECLFRERVISTSSNSDVRCEMVTRTSTSLPNVNFADAPDAADVASAPQVRVIPIEMEEMGTLSADELHTPTRKPKTADITKPPTPDSVAKSHKRLEWDSLGDVGYKKSMSTSNISVMERTLLREFFQESTTTPSTSCSSRKLSANASEGDLQRLQEKSLNESKSTPASSTQAHRTPPLASSTLVEVRHEAVVAIGSAACARPKVSQGTSMSLKKSFEKSSQTTMEWAGAQEVCSQEIQVNISSCAATSSYIGSSATPSSFEYHSPGSASAITSGVRDGSGRGVNRSKRFSAGHDSETQQSTTKTSDRPLRRKVLGTLESVGLSGDDDNKENSQLEKWPSARAQQLDKGVHLLMSLMDSRSLNSAEKRQLVRSIVKRIMRESVCERANRKRSEVSKASRSSFTSEQSTTSSRVEQVPVHSEGSEYSVQVRQLERRLPTAESIKQAVMRQIEKINETNSAEGENLVKMEVFDKVSPANMSANALANVAADVAAARQQQQPLPPPPPSVIDVKSNTRVSKVVPAKTNINKDLIIKTLRSSGSPAAITATSASISSISSKEIITLKPVMTTGEQKRESGASTDADQASMHEWLNPLTQSELDYEEKHRELEKNATARERILRMTAEDKTITERAVQLNWIDLEIRRLEGLRKLLGKEYCQPKTYKTPMVNKPEPAVTAPAEQCECSLDKIYDTVCSEQTPPTSSSLTSTPKDDRSGDRCDVEVVEVICEESNEKIIDLDENLKRSKERKRKTHILYDKPTVSEDHNLADQALGKPVFRSMKETITTKEEQLLNPEELQHRKPPPPPPATAQQQSIAGSKQRSKLDTPVGSNDSESVRSFVQQRKREFMDHYKNQKQSHYDALRQQQEEAQSKAHTTAAASVHNHYSVPHTMRRICPNHFNEACYCHFHHQSHPCFCHWRQPQACPHQRMAHTFGRPSPAPPPPPPPPAPLIAQSKTSRTPQYTEYSGSAGLNSSPLCISSEVSVPMGSNASSSTLTTTHQYDDVNAAIGLPGVGVQTGDSLRRSLPFYGRRAGFATTPYTPARRPCVRTSSSSQLTVGMQARPKGIAYVITFDGKTSDEEEALKGATAAVASTSTSEQLQPALQDYLERAKPKFCAQSKERKAILNRIQVLRQQRERTIRDIVDNTSFGSMERQLDNHLPLPRTRQLRIFNTKEMKARTNKRFATLPEVLEKQQREREERRRRSNRIMRDVFNRRLQKRVRSGMLDLNHSRTII